ncbi:MAG TPA: hypothetical protein VLW85_01035 [Myxococcales bacterium]|nr:hypothetical protein [Myxococcales bacterium]
MKSQPIAPKPSMQPQARSAPAKLPAGDFAAELGKQLAPRDDEKPARPAKPPPLSQAHAAQQAPLPQLPQLPLPHAMPAQPQPAPQIDKQIQAVVADRLSQAPQRTTREAAAAPAAAVPASKEKPSAPAAQPHAAAAPAAPATRGPEQPAPAFAVAAPKPLETPAIAAPHVPPPTALLQPAAADPSLRVAVLPQAAHMKLEVSGAELAVHMRLRDGVANLTVAGEAAPVLHARADELRSALAVQGVSLGRIDPVLPTAEATAAGGQLPSFQREQGERRERPDPDDQEATAPARKPLARGVHVQA